jgi:hypothetical protein
MTMVSVEDIERGALPDPLDPGSPQARAAMALMEAYYKVWNAKDAETLASKIYRLGPTRPLQTPADFRRVLDQTRAEGWDYSTLHDAQVFPWGEDAFLVRGLFNRFTAEGNLLPPADRLTAYVVAEFPDGMRITDLPLAYDRA